MAAQATSWLTPAWLRLLVLRFGQSAYWVVIKLLSLLERRGPNFALLGNFAPVHQERVDSGLKVEGQLPPALDGAFMRIGPNPAQEPIAGYHLFDGDGMVHAVTLSPAQGTATYSNHQVRTSRLRQEAEAGWPLFAKIGDYVGVRGLATVLLNQLAMKLGLMDVSQGVGTANTALVFHARKLLALHEGDLPYALRLPASGGPISTLGRLSFDGKLGHPFTAHPKIDPETGELFFFGYSVHSKPYCWFSRLSPSGELVADFPVPLQQPVMMHDMAMTRNYIVVVDVPLVFKPETMVKQRTLPFVFEKRPARFGVLPRDATSAAAIRWFSTEPLMSFHVANAWEEGSTIKVFLCTFNEFSLELDEKGAPKQLSRLSEICLDLETGAASVRRVCHVPGDFPQVPPALLGRRTRYTYIAAFDAENTKMPTFKGIAKVDLAAPDADGALAGMVEYGPGCAGGEAIFVPSGQEGAAEDDGYLVSFVHNMDNDRSELAVYDTRTMSSKPVARVPLCSRVPFGFHAQWVPAAELARQVTQL